MRFFWSSKVRVEGIRVKNSPQFHFRFDSCSDVHIDSLFIKSPAGSPNTDGIHLENTNDVTIYNSIIANGTVHLYIYISIYLYSFNSITGDDCVSIGAGTFNVDIRNITCGPSHGIRYFHYIHISTYIFM